MDILKHSTYVIIISIGIVFTLLSCSSDNNTTENTGDEFDRSAMLENVGNNIILPSYNSLQQEVNNLKTDLDNFVADPTVSNLQNAQTSLKEARIAWQYANMYQFGPAETVALRASINTYPADTTKIKSNIESGDAVLGTLDNRDAAGFPTLGYLLHGIGDTQEDIVSQYSTASNAQANIDYLISNIDFIKSNVDNVVDEWQADGGDYIGTFLSSENAGVDVGSSLGLLANAAFFVHYERFLRDAKIGIPAGVRTANIPRPGNVEAYFAGYSAELALKNMEATRNLYAGISPSGTDGIGFEENLVAVGAEDLSNDILTNFGEAITSLEELNDPLTEQIQTNNDPVLDTFVEVLDVVALLKAEMASRLGITVTFQDNDGD